ncbi:MAG: hypothetical protein A3G20_08025 [Acidobacteria bacterium RIFCSPLOWO2_12_FULL_59_11]|nr:MAG: hypothetical protein A3G20_08025 [Acidobacteria bacterium RIFCSPLOWO2_12_FULL_59_11]
MAVNLPPSWNKLAAGAACGSSSCRCALPKLHGHVERANRTHTEEFYEFTPCSLQIPALNQELLAWERTYNTVRPRQPLATSPHSSSYTIAHVNEKSLCVTNLLDEYRLSTAAFLIPYDSSLPS